jgi:RHS repeat-associated protein
MRTRATSTQPTIEQFTNDATNRLTLAQLTKVQGVAQATPITTAALSYDLLGNLCSKNGQAYRYAGPAGCSNHGSTGSPHAATQVGTTTYQFDGNGNQTTSSSGRTLVYNALNQLASAASGTTSTTFQYAPDGDRFLRTDGAPRVWPSDCKSASDRIFCDGFEGGGSSGGVQTTIYLGSVELIRTGSTTETRRYLAGVAIDYVRSSGANETRFLLADHLGSLDVVASSTGAPIETASFDVHGSRRDPVTWQGPAPAPVSTTRGYTGHEHVDGAGFIHMNGRLYDPALGRMLQADPLTGPGPQGLNRYSYVANNPLTLTDPSGYSWWKDLLGVAIAVFAPELLPATWGVWVYVASGFVAGTVAGGNLQGGLYGAFSAGLFYGIGQAFDPGGFANSWATRGVQNGNGVFDTSYNLAGFSAKVIAHGIAGGVMSSLEGGRFGNGFLSAGVSEAFAGAIDRLDPANPLGRRVSAERVVAASILGGTTSLVAGGKFANGAITAAFGRAFNEESAALKSKRAARATLTINSSATPDAASVTDGHAWIVVTDNATGITHSYGLWQDGYADDQDPNHERTDVHEDVEFQRHYSAVAWRSYSLTDAQFDSLETYIHTYDDWGMFHTCADWAAGAVNVSVGVSLPVGDPSALWLSGSPRQLTITLQYLQRTTGSTEGQK